MKSAELIATDIDFSAALSRENMKPHCGVGSHRAFSAFCASELIHLIDRHKSMVATVVPDFS